MEFRSTKAGAARFARFRSLRARRRSRCAGPPPSLRTDPAFAGLAAIGPSGRCPACPCCADGPAQSTFGRGHPGALANRVIDRKRFTRPRGTPLDHAVRDWGAELAERLLISVDPSSLEWRNSPIRGGDTTNPWFLEQRASADGDKTSQFISSLSPGGEKLMGILRSKPF